MAEKDRKTDETLDRVLEAIRAGMDPEDACVSEGIARRTYREWKRLARQGSEEHIARFEAFDRAKTEGERSDVDATRKAAQPKRMTLCCQECSAPVEVDLSDLERWHGQQVDAAKVALERLARRNPRSWAPSSRVSIDAEANAILDLAQQVLDPARYPGAFQELLAAYVECTGGVVPVVEQPPSEGDGSPPVH